MAPPITNDLLLAAAIASAAHAAAAQTPTNSNRSGTGVVTKITQNANQAVNRSTMYIDGTTDQRLTTDANSTLHVLFSDQSAITLGPNSELSIAKYVFDTKAKDGQILIDLTKGLLRVVGGLISKRTETVVRTSTATIGIRGGISLVETNGQQTSATFLFGQSLRATDSSGNNSQTITRPGFGTNFGSQGNISSRTSRQTLNQQLLRFGNHSSGSTQGQSQPGGAPPGQITTTGGTPNSDNSLSNDRLSQTVDNNVDFAPTLRVLLGSGQTPIES
jgi:hypothetical protein